MPTINPVREERLRAFHQKIALYQTIADRENCESSLSAFFEGAWPCINSAEYQSGWAVDAMCDHLEGVVYGHIPRLLINCPPRCSKPVAYDAFVLSKKGVVRLEEINVGDFVWTHRARWRKVLEVHENGELPILRIMTETGRVVETAGDHPFLTPTGWVKAEKLVVGDVLGLVPNYDQSCGGESITPKEARLLGYLIGDGHCASSPSITCADDAVAEDIARCASALGFNTKEVRYKITNTGAWLRFIKIKAGEGHKHFPFKGYIGPVREWLSKHKLEKQSSYTKCVPEAVMKGSAEIVCAFLGAYWSCDGWADVRRLRKSDKDSLRFHCSSVNRVLMDQIQILLLRLGINSFVRERFRPNLITKRQGKNGYTTYALTISQEHAWRFLELIKFYHQRFDTLDYAIGKKSDFDRRLIADQILQIRRFSKKKRCICLTVEEDRSFTANGFAVHNTSLVSISFPAWVWAQPDISYLSGPQVEFLCASYGHTLALDSSNKCRRLIASPWYQERWGSRFQLRYDQNTKFHWENDKGGARIATSVGGTLLGLGGAILLADDLNNTQDVESDAEREQVKNFWQEFHTTRLNDPKQAAIIAIQQRLHESDNSGLILASDEKWVHLRIPMRYETNYTYHTVILPQYDSEEPWDDPRSEEGELMWEERFGEAEVRKLEIQLGPYMAAGRLQQRPSPKGGGILQRDFWQPWDKIEAAKYRLEWVPNRREYPPFELVIGSLDTSYGEKEENDYNALTIWGLFLDVTNTRRTLLAYAWNKRLPLNGKVLTQQAGEADINFRDRQKQAWGLVENVADTCKRYKVQRLLIENKTRGVDVANELRRLYVREDWGIQLITPTKDKVSRAHSVVPLFTDGSVYAPIDRKWCADLIDQCALFPKGDFDDMVDSSTQALKWMREAGLLLRAEEQEAEIADSIRFYNQEESVSARYGV